MSNKWAASFGIQFLRICIRLGIIQGTVLSRGLQACALAHVALALHLIRKFVAPSHSLVGHACGSLAGLHCIWIDRRTLSAFPNLGFVIQFAVKVANPFVSALPACPVVISREVCFGGGDDFALAGCATLAVAVAFGWVMRAHFSWLLRGG